MKRLLKLLPQSSLSNSKKRKLALLLASALAGEARTNAVMRENEPEHDEEADAQMKNDLMDIFAQREAGSGLTQLTEDEWRSLD